jgi:hypothetical protein
MEISIQILSWLALILLGLVQLLREKSFREAKQAQLDAKDERIAGLKEALDLLDRFSPPKIEEHLLSFQRLVEARVTQTEEEAALKRAELERAVVEKDSELKRLRSGSATATSPAEAAVLQQQIVEFQTRAEALGALTATLDQLKGAWQADVQDAFTKLTTYRDRAAELRAQISELTSLGADGVCPTCGRRVGADYERLVEELTDQWTLLVQDGRWQAQRYDQLSTKPEEIVLLENQIAALTSITTTSDMPLSSESKS